MLEEPTLTSRDMKTYSRSSEPFFLSTSTVVDLLFPASTGVNCLPELPQFINVKEHYPISIEYRGAHDHQVENP
jgi:hypothetical protein